jgi:uncharacterized metal-binding protein
MSHPEKVNIVPCSGIGKPVGSVSRLAAYYLHEDDLPEQTNLIPLALLVLGDSATNELVKAHPSITLDGCPKQCAKRIVGECGGQVVQDIVIMDVYRNNNHLKPEGIAELNESGQLLARVAADMAKCTIDASNDCSEEEPYA